MAADPQPTRYIVNIGFVVDPSKFSAEDRAVENNEAKFSRNVIVDFLESEGTVYDYADTLRFMGVTEIGPTERELPGDEV